MKKNWSLVNNKRSIYLAIALLILSFSIASVFSGCSMTEDDVNSTVNLDSKQPVEETEVQINHNIEPSPTSLLESDMVLSLEGYGAKGALSDDDLTIVDMLMYAVQDEYLARGEYLAIIDEFGVQRPYSNIVKSEETHLAFLEEVYNSYNINFPANNSEEHLIIPSNLLEAAETGVQAEIDNIEMYERFLEFELPKNIENVFYALKNGSDSHLLAFQKQVEGLN